MIELHGRLRAMRTARDGFTTRLAGVLIPVGLLALGLCAAEAEPSRERAFLEENGVAMTSMMEAMKSQPTGDIDRDFVAMMVPHHAGAIAMAETELRYGGNEQLRRIAQEIIVDQQQEIAAMKAAVASSGQSGSH